MDLTEVGMVLRWGLGASRRVVVEGKWEVRGMEAERKGVGLEVGERWVVVRKGVVGRWVWEVGLVGVVQLESLWRRWDLWKEERDGDLWRGGWEGWQKSECGVVWRHWRRKDE